MRVLSDSGEPGCKSAVCFLLQGSKEQVFLARCILENLITESEPVTVNVEVPQTAFGRIIGSCQDDQIDSSSLSCFLLSTGCQANALY